MCVGVYVKETESRGEGVERENHLCYQDKAGIGCSNSLWLFVAVHPLQR